MTNGSMSLEESRAPINPIKNTITITILRGQEREVSPSAALTVYLLENSITSMRTIHQSGLPLPPPAVDQDIVVTVIRELIVTAVVEGLEGCD